MMEYIIDKWYKLKLMIAIILEGEASKIMYVAIRRLNIGVSELLYNGDGVSRGNNLAIYVTHETLEDIRANIIKGDKSTSDSDRTIMTKNLLRLLDLASDSLLDKSFINHNVISASLFMISSYAIFEELELTDETINDFELLYSLDTYDEQKLISKLMINRHTDMYESMCKN